MTENLSPAVSDTYTRPHRRRFSMAKVIYDPILDSFSGKIGNFVYYKNRSARCVRRYVIPRNPRTLSQQRRRVRFADAVHLWQQLPYSIIIPYRQENMVIRIPASFI